MKLHFNRDVLPDSVSSDFSKLNKFSEQQFQRLIEILFQFLLEPKEAERFMQQLSEFAAEQGLSAGPLKSLMKSVLLLPQGAVKKNLTSEQIRDDLLTLGRTVSWGENCGSLSRLAVGQTLMVNQLVDLEWKFGGEPAQRSELKLVVRRGSSTENVYMELTLPQFYNFLHEMERAKASMECFS
uniref:COMM domain containing 7 n=1 Tax=Salarias fasciatus TaxID=181472 RepID=A0A672HRU0_SALFA